jgi:HEAT repeat protein
MNEQSEFYTLLDELYKESIFDAFTNGVEKKLILIEDFIQLTNIKGIPYLLPLCIHNNKKVATFVLQKITPILRSIDRKHYIMLDQSIRELHEYKYKTSFVKWASMTPEYIQETVVKKQQYNVHFLGLLSFHRNGYIREKALQLLSLIETGETIPYFILRLNDHVKGIRKLAAQQLYKRMTNENADHILDNLFLFNHIKQYSREKFNDLFIQMDHFLSDPQLKFILLEKLASKNSYVGRFSANYLLMNPDPEIIEKVIRHFDFVIRIKASEYIVGILELGEQITWYKTLKSDSNMQVRRNAFLVLLKQPREKIVSEISSFLLDKHKSIREMARFYVGKLEIPIDILELYIQNVYSQNEIISALAGIGEIGNREQLDLIKMFVCDPRTKVRSAVLKALSRFAGHEEKEVFLQALLDSSPKISKIAAKALTDKSCKEEVLFSLFLKEFPVHVKRNIIHIFDHFSKEESITALIKALYHAPEMKALIEDKIRKWLRGFNRSFYLNLNQVQKQNMKELIFRVKNTLSQDIIKEFELILK